MPASPLLTPSLRSPEANMEGPRLAAVSLVPTVYRACEHRPPTPAMLAGKSAPLAPRPLFLTHFILPSLGGILIILAARTGTEPHSCWGQPSPPGQTADTASGLWFQTNQLPSPSRFQERAVYVYFHVRLPWFPSPGMSFNDLRYSALLCPFSQVRLQWPWVHACHLSRSPQTKGALLLPDSTACGFSICFVIHFGHFLRKVLCLSFPPVSVRGGDDFLFMFSTH